MQVLPTAHLPVPAVLHPDGVRCPELNPAQARPLGLNFAHAADACIAHLSEAARAGRCGIRFRNTVKDAVDAYERLRRIFADQGLQAIWGDCRRPAGARVLALEPEGAVLPASMRRSRRM